MVAALLQLMSERSFVCRLIHPKLLLTYSKGLDWRERMQFGLGYVRLHEADAAIPSVVLAMDPVIERARDAPHGRVELWNHPHNMLAGA